MKYVNGSPLGSILSLTLIENANHSLSKIVEDGQVSQACKVVYKIVAPGILLYIMFENI